MNRFDDWKFKDEIRMQNERMMDDRMRMDMMRDKIYPPINDPIRPRHDPIDLRPLNRALDMQDNFRRPMPGPHDFPRDIRPDPIRPMNIARGVDMRPLNDMFMMQKKGVF